MAEEIKLDADVFKALSSDTRLEIVRSLGERRMTVTELSKSLDVSKSTVHEHLSRLSDVDLVEKAENDNKWVYYELTGKGKEILHPHRKTKILLFTAAAAALFVGSGYELFRTIPQIFPGQTLGASAVEAQKASGQTLGTASQAPEAASQMPWLQLALAIVMLAAASYLAFRLWRLYRK